MYFLCINLMVVAKVIIVRLCGAWFATDPVLTPPYIFSQEIMKSCYNSVNIAFSGKPYT
jgi:hypothetical protein